MGTHRLLMGTQFICRAPDVRSFVLEPTQEETPPTDVMTLGWKQRRGRPGSPNEKTVYGSYYATLPKGLIERLRWQRGESLRPRVADEQLIIEKASPPPRLVAAGQDTENFQLDRVICGDVLESMARIPENSVHMAITSPPYNVAAGYSNYTDDREYDEYREWLSKVWKETRRVLVPGGRFALNIAPTSIKNYRPVHMDLSEDVEEAGLEPRTEIIWYKQNMTAKRTAWGSFRNPRHPHVIPSWEYVLIFHKDQWKLEGDPLNADISSKDFVAWSDGMWRINPETSHHADHPAAFPEELIQRLIQYFSYKGNTVLDMFGGTGTVATVAHRLDRRFIHIDVNPDYCAAAKQRLAGKLERGKRTKPSQRSLLREAGRRTPVAGNSLESFEASNSAKRTPADSDGRKFAA
jgi:DNA modification methylase